MDERIIKQKTAVTLAEAAAQAAPLPVPPPPPPVVPMVQPPQSAPAQSTRSNRMVLIVAAVLALGILIFGFLYLKSSTQPKEAPMTPIIPTTVPSPTPQPNLSRISTTSAFMGYSEEVASFSAILNAFSLQDGTLIPPILDIELDLKN